MARVSANQLLSRLEKGKPVPAILLLGEEPYLRDSCRTLLIERYVPEAARSWAVSRYSADRGGTQAALEQAQTMAMLSQIGRASCRERLSVSLDIGSVRNNCVE